MIFVWLIALLRFFAKLVIIPLEDNEIFLDINAKCPCCGHKNGKLTSVIIDGKLLVQHHCNIDGANWFEDPIVSDAQKFVYPQIINPPQ